MVRVLPERVAAAGIAAPAAVCSVQLPAAGAASGSENVSRKAVPTGIPCAPDAGSAAVSRGGTVSRVTRMPAGSVARATSRFWPSTRATPASAKLAPSPPIGAGAPLTVTTRPLRCSTVPPTATVAVLSSAPSAGCTMCTCGAELSRTTVTDA